VEIRVAQGTYNPKQGLLAMPEFGWRTATFQLINGVTLRGGYAGLSEPAPNARDVALYQSILSGDLDGDDSPNFTNNSENSYHVVTGSQTDKTAMLDGFVITAGNADGPIFDNEGVDDFRLRCGGGMYNVSGNPTLRHCLFRENSADWNGGGMYNSSSSPTITNCTFDHNRAPIEFWSEGGGMWNEYGSNPIVTNCAFVGNLANWGSGMANHWDSNPTVNSCTFEGNLATEWGYGSGISNMRSSPTVIDCIFSGNLGAGMDNLGQSRPIVTGCMFTLNGLGGMYNDYSSPVVTNCTFEKNPGGGMSNSGSSPILAECTFSRNTEEWGGGMDNFYSSPILSNCTFAGNSATYGGAIAMSETSLSVENCTFVRNSAQYGSAIGCDSGRRRDPSGPSSVSMSNCILWDEGSEVWNHDYSTIVITYSDIQGDWNGEGNIDVDPLFANPGYWADVNDPNIVVEPNDPNAVWVDGDYHLRSEAGRWDPVAGAWLKDDVTSPCIDSGDPNSDWGVEVWPHGGRVNMGAYGGTPQASLSVEPQAMSLPRVAYVHHNKTDVAEGYRALLTAYGCPTTLIPGDQVATTTLDDYDLIVAGTDTGYSDVWADEQNVAAVEGSGKPVVGLSRGGYWYFGKLGLTIGRPNGGHDSGSAIEPVDPSHPLFSEPYPIEIPEGGVLELCAEADQINIYLWPAAPDTVTTLGLDAGNAGYYPLVLEHDRYFFWGYDVSAEDLTAAGRKLFVNMVIRTANSAW
jgi:predicted outer membrane repeat protein